MGKPKPTFRHKRPRNALLARLTGWRKMKIEEIPVGATFVNTRIGKTHHACVLLESWHEVPVPDSREGLVQLFARCRSWHVLAKGYPEEEFDHTQPYQFLKGRRVWAHIPKA